MEHVLHVMDLLILNVEAVIRDFIFLAQNVKNHVHQVIMLMEETENAKNVMLLVQLVMVQDQEDVIVVLQVNS